MLLKSILLALMLVLSVPASAAEMSASLGKDYIRISDKECTEKAVLDRIPPDQRPLFRKAEATVGGVDYKACWMYTPQAIKLIYEDGDEGLIPPQAFKVVDTI